MLSHDLAGPYQARAAEYLIAVVYLLLFVPFWRFVNGGRAGAPAVDPARPATHNGWFGMPPGLRFHPGHAWARCGAALVTVGLDDFARKLVGPLTAVQLPATGSTVAQGEKAWTLVASSRSVDMLSPVDGTVVAVNRKLAEAPAALEQDPYSDGWLLMVRPSRLEANLKQLLSGGVARKWMEGVADALRERTGPGLGLLAQDGGTPVNGIARELDPERWDEVARTFLLS
jgi:glycine cleavage system H lipoate-binding protein